MSYNFRLFKKQADIDPLVTARTQPDNLKTTPPVPAKEAFKRKLADALMAADPKLTITPIDFEELTKEMTITVEQARIVFRHLNLNGPVEDGDSIQVTLYDDEAVVAVPLWREAALAKDAVQQIWKHFAVLQKEAGYLIYDPNMEVIVELASGFDYVLASYNKVVKNAPADDIAGNA